MSVTGGTMDPYAAYAEQAAATASPAQLVLMLYDGALSRVAAAEAALAASPVAVEAAHLALGKAQAIVHELAVTLDHDRGGVVAANLATLYAYCAELLITANVAKDASPLREVTDVLAGLRDAWEQACVVAPVAVAG